MRIQTNNADYQQNILQAEKASSTEEKLSFYSTAVDIKPLVMDAYLGMVDAVKDDAIFTTDEETAIKKKLNANVSALRNEEGYAEVAFEVGKVYWYYYDYGKTETADNDATRMKSAIQWFEDAAKYGSESDEFYTMAVVYRDIGKFNRDINLSVQEATDSDKMYLSYWNNLSNLVGIITSSKDESEIVELEIYKLALNSMETYARKFKKATVEQSDMQKLFDTVKQALNNVSTTSDTTEDLKTSVVNRISQTQVAIDNAYRE